MFNDDIRKLKKDKKNYDAIFNIIGNIIAKEVNDNDENKDVLENLNYDSYLKLPSELKEKVDLKIDKYLKNAYRTPNYLKFDKKMKALTRKKINNVDDFLKLGVKFNKNEKNKSDREEKKESFSRKENKISKIEKSELTLKSVAKIAGTTSKFIFRTGLGVCAGCFLLGMFQFFGAAPVLPIVTTLGIGGYLVVNAYKDVKKIAKSVKSIIKNIKINKENKKSKNNHVNTKKNNLTYPILDMQDEKDLNTEYPILDIDDYSMNVEDEKNNSLSEETDSSKEEIENEHSKENIQEEKINNSIEETDNKNLTSDNETDSSKEEIENEHSKENIQEEKINNSIEETDNKNLTSDNETNSNKQEDKDIEEDDENFIDDNMDKDINVSNLSDTDLKISEIRETVNKIKILNNYKKNLETRYDFIQNDILQMRKYAGGLTKNEFMKPNQSFANRINQTKELTRKIKKCENAILMHKNMIQKELDYKKLSNESRSIQNLEQMRAILISLSEMHKKSERFIEEITVSEEKYKSR